MKITFITTVYNEEETIEIFLDSLFIQSRLPDEVIIVDGGSRDHTLDKIKNQTSNLKNYKGKCKIFLKKGNRSIGRNEAIKNASGDIIVCSDSGNMLDKDWIKNITTPFINPQTDVVAGYYKGKAETIFQKCLIPYVLVMEDRVDPKTFLPATRSIAFRKKIWEKIGGFDEKLSHNEDYAFAKRLKKIKINIIFKKDAIVYWIPRSTFRQAFSMFFRFAYGDAEARIFRPKVVFLFIRYILGILLVSSAIITQSPVLIFSFVLLCISYILWSINKNYRYVKKWKAIFLLPMLQITADFAVICGTILGVFKIWDIQKTQ